MRKFNMFITAVCVLFLIKLRWPKNISIYVTFCYTRIFPGLYSFQTQVQANINRELEKSVKRALNIARYKNEAASDTQWLQFTIVEPYLPFN